MLHRKHYREIAKIINRYLNYDNICIETGEFVDALSDYFKQDNSNFDKNKFVDACFMQGGIK